MPPVDDAPRPAAGDPQPVDDAPVLPEPPAPLLLAAPPGLDLDATLAAVGRLGDARETPHEERYHDTDDLRLARAGTTLRHADGAWTLSLGWSYRPLAPIVRNGTEAAAPDELAELVLASTRGRGLQPVAHIATRRRAAPLVRDQETVAWIDDREISVLHDGRVGARSRELFVTFEARTGPPVPHLRDIVRDALVHAGAHPCDPVAPLERALGTRARPFDPRRAVLTPQSRTVDVLRHALTVGMLRLLQSDPVARLGDDDEGVHQARVALRRIRSDLRTFREVLDPEWVESLRAELAWAGAEFGAVRDLDVLRDLLVRRSRGLAPDDQHALQPVLDEIHAEHDRAREKLLHSLRSARYLTLLDDIEAATRAPVILPVALEPAAERARALVRRSARKLRRAVAALDPAPEDEALHRVRLLAKRARYAAEAVEPAFGSQARTYARQAAAVQTVLGEHQDAVMAQVWLRSRVRESTPETAYALGSLAGLFRADAARASAAWPAVWRRTDRPRHRRWLGS